MPWRWAEGIVDPGLEHLELYYDRVTDSGDSWRKIAMVGKPEGCLFPVTWLVDSGNPEEAIMIDVVRKDLDYYLLDVGGPIPWEYAVYHSMTAANIYSMVHWVHVEGEKLVSCTKKPSDLQ